MTWRITAAHLGRSIFAWHPSQGPLFQTSMKSEITWRFLYTMTHYTCYLLRDHFAIPGYGMMHAGCFSILIKYTFVKSLLPCTMEYVEAGVSRCWKMFRRLNYILHVT